MKRIEDVVNIKFDTLTQLVFVYLGVEILVTTT